MRIRELPHYLGVVFVLAIGGLLAVGCWKGLVESLAPLDGLVVDHAPESRIRACGIVVLNDRSERLVLNADSSGCQALRIGRRVHKDAWSLTYRSDSQAVWQESPAAFWLGGVFGSLFTTSWVLAILWVILSAWRDSRRPRSPAVPSPS